LSNGKWNISSGVQTGFDYGFVRVPYFILVRLDLAFRLWRFASARRFPISYELSFGFGMRSGAGGGEGREKQERTSPENSLV